MKRQFGLIVTGIVASMATGSAAQCGEATPAVTPKAVVELFTSQGCSSCPPADALIEKLSADRSIITLSFPVDYWDYLGWKDTFAKPDFSIRQRDYAQERGDRAVYTPQIVVDGRSHVVGSDAVAVERAVATETTHRGGLPVALSVDMVGDALVAHVGAAADPAAAKATVWLVKFGRSEVVTIGRGENSGRTVTYTHVVKEMQPIGMWKGQPMSIELPRVALMRSKNCGYALLLQTDNDGRPGPILGAATLEDANPS
ncbi:MAG: DUF1223 domain-containing protein [Ancalomicrobiaceae bacterium]|nr:DUF1223 domain-containing protein [Ancalomicrobiaceae bacterium]